MATNNKFQSYEDLFGDIDFKKGREGRSVYSPAAYLVDLLQLLEEKFGEKGGGFYDRRSDVKEISLNGKNTFTLVPYLNIVNAILEEKIRHETNATTTGLTDTQKKKVVYDQLKALKYPFNLPFNLENEKYKKNADYLDARPHELYTMFSLRPEAKVIAQEFLGLSDEELNTITTSPVNAIEFLKDHFGLTKDFSTSFNRLSDVSDFLAITGLTGGELRELLFQNLSSTAKKALDSTDTELNLASRFFINNGLGGVARLSDDEASIIWGPASGNTNELLTSAWFTRIQRASRFIRLAKKINVSFSDLGLILRSCCQNVLDVKAVQIVAIIIHLHQQHDLPIDEVCALVSNVSTIGIGDEEAPADLFNRTFNTRFSSIDKKYLTASEYLPEAYADPMVYEPLTCHGDVLQPEHKDYRKRLCKALGLSEKNLALIVNRFRMRSKDDATKATLLVANQGIDLQALSLLFRISKLSEVLDLSCAELFDLMDVLEGDPTIRAYNQFSILINDKPTELDAYKIIQGIQDGNPGEKMEARLWLIQTMSNLAGWMQSYDFLSEELKQIMTGAFKTEKEKTQSDKQKLEFLNGLYEQFKPMFFKANNFESERFDQRASAVIHRTLVSDKNKMVAQKDKRLLAFEASEAARWAHRSIHQLGVFRKEDFLQLGISEKMLDKIYNNLLIKEYLNADGDLVEDNFPKNPGSFKINNSTTAEKKALFETIHDIYQSTNGHTEDEVSEDLEEIDLAIFLSDLDTLNLTNTRKLELYDNLIFNGYIDEQGSVLQPDFFSTKKNYVEFEPNAKIDAYSQQVYNQIKTSTDLFEKSKLVLSRDVFQHLDLHEVELDDLMENLRFNEYTNAENAILHKNKILALDIKDFNLALMYYPQRHEILATVKEVILKFKTNFYRFPKETFRAIADEIVADRLFRYLQNDFMQDGMMNEDQRDFFKDADNLEYFNPGPYFTEIYSKSAFEAIGQFIDTAEAYQFIPADLRGLDFYEDEIIAILEILQEKGMVVNGNIPEDQMAYFLNVNNALNFNVEGYEDKSKDIFFSIYGIATEVESAVLEIVEKIRQIASDQETVLLDALAENFELTAEVVNVVLSHLYGTSKSKVETFMLPVFDSVDELDQIPVAPTENNFNLNYRRLRQISLLVSKLRLNEEETDAIFDDQNLVDKFPEKISLPAKLSSFDLLLEGMDDKIYLFKNNKYWTYSATTYALLEAEKDLHLFSEKLRGINRLDAAFVDAKGNTWLIVGAQYFCKAKGAKTWESKTKILGKVQSNFNNPERIDASFKDHEGKTYLFSGDQYARYADNYSSMETGYPKKIEGNWKNELQFELPEKYYESIDASFESRDNTTYLFKEDKFVSSKDFSTETDINSVWAKVKNNFEGADKLDSIFVHDGEVYCFSGNQLLIYSDSIENDKVLGDEGSLMKIKSKFAEMPFEFENGIDAIFQGFDNKIHVFKEHHYTTFDANFKNIDQGNLIDKWGKVENQIQFTGLVDAAFAGLDGRTYLFSGGQYYRYSTSDYSKVDEGYPRSVKTDWGGLRSVEAAFILDGKTYVFGRNDQDVLGYLAFTTNDYSDVTTADLKDAKDNWWNLPESLVKENFSTPDAVFIGNDGNTYLFRGDKYVAYENNHRWWTEPKPVNEKWDSLPFESITAAFTGKDGNTYIFEGPSPEGERAEGEEMVEAVSVNEGAATDEFHGLRFVRYSNKNYTKIDDRFPKVVKNHWGKVTNNFASSRKIDAAIALHSPSLNADGTAGTPLQHTYVFSGNQFFRYTGSAYDVVDEGYPKNIKTALKKEPRFSNLSEGFENGIDAAMADQRNIYLFKGDSYHVFSADLQRTYPQLLNGKLNTAFLENDSVYLLENDNDWSKHNALENVTLNKKALKPVLLRKLPASFQNGIDAVLHGLDCQAYVFKGGQCFNVNLQQAYPLNSEWGRTKNNIFIDNQVDAAFMGRDGKRYLFSGDQFVSYTPDKQGDFSKFTDAIPQSIKEHWGGLKNVEVAYVMDEKTYLMESPDKEGVFRYVCYSTDDYANEKIEAPREANFFWWGIPSVYKEEEFNDVKAVLADEDNVFYLSDAVYVQYNRTKKKWMNPKPLNRMWRNIPLNDTDFKTITTAYVHGEDQITFFGDGHFTHYSKSGQGSQSFSVPQSIKSSWGLVSNNIVLNNKIDAAVVFKKKTTYLFSGDQYVRYSTDNYQYVDAGYPKKMKDNLRQEKAFKNLPESIEEKLNSLTAKDVFMDAVIANDRNVYLFENGHLHVASQSLSQSYDLNKIGQLKNNIKENNRVDAAFRMRDMAFLFSGDQYIRYSSFDMEYVDEGYPKSIQNNLFTSKGMNTAEEENFFYDIDAALMGEDDLVYIFKDKKYYTSPVGIVLKPVVEAELRPITNLWGKSHNNFVAETGNVSVDAAFIAPDGKFYAFKGGQYIQYTDFENEYVDEGFPKPINDNWGDLHTGSVKADDSRTPDFESGIDSAFVFDGKTYMVKGDWYVRYSSDTYALMDSIYPQPFTLRWGRWNDFLLNDIKAISRFKKLQDEYLGDDFVLSDFLYEGKGYKKEPYKLLAELFDWKIEQVKWLKRKNVFLTPENQFEVQFGLEQMLKLYDIFELADKMEIDPQHLFEEVWTKRYAQKDTAAAADYLYTALALKNSDKDREVLSDQIHREMNQLQRDALLNYTIFLTEGVDNSRDLYSLLLVDVEMGNIGMTSTIKEAISAVQLYLHRYFVNLEESSGTKLTATQREQLKKWWKWMRNYRVWEANRKVFLYPENYIRPELRDTKTPEFKKLEEALLQGEINRENVESAFREYLNDFALVGNLRVTGANVYKDKFGNNILMLFGKTRTEPFDYYYRTARFINGAVEWTAWENVNIPINSDRVFPVHAFGRTIAFWIEIEEREDSKGRARTEGNVTDVGNYDNKVKHRAHIHYAFYNFNNRWSTPQVLKRDIKLNYEIDAIFTENNEKIAFSGKYCLKTSSTNPTGDVKTIEETFPNLPQSFYSGIDAAMRFKGNRYFFKGGKYYSPDLHRNRTARNLNSFIKMTGGKQLVVINIFGIGRVEEIDIPAEPLPEGGYDAAFVIGNDIVCLIDKTGKYTFFQSGSGNTITPIKAAGVNELFPGFHAFVHTLSNKSGNFAQADAVFKEDDLYYVLRDGQYECYNFTNGELSPMEGFPKPIKGNLSFNMDKFFNKLHAVWNPTKGGNIHLTYATPKDEVLLSGELLPDFSFEELEPNDSFVNKLLLGWEEILRNTNADNFNRSLHDNAEAVFSDAETKVDEFKEQAEEIIDWNAAIGFLQTAAESAGAFSNGKPATQKTSFINAIGSLNAQLANQSNGEVATLRQSGVQLNNAFTIFDASDGDDLEIDRVSLRSAVQSSANTVNAQKAKSATAVENLKAGIASYKGTLDSAEGQSVRPNADQHRDVAVKFENFLHNTTTYVNHIKRSGVSLGDDNDEKPTSELLQLPANTNMAKSYRDNNSENETILKDSIRGLNNIGGQSSLTSIVNQLDSTKALLETAAPNFDLMLQLKQAMEEVKDNVIAIISEPLDSLREIVFGRFDLFDPEFEIINKNNFTFSEPDWYVFEAKRGTFLARPLEDQKEIDNNGQAQFPYELIRLTTTTIPNMSTQLFTGGVPALLSLATQQFREFPGFGNVEDGISFNPNKIKKVPTFQNLDFGGANSDYYWEIFFHIPFLIAQSLNTAQKFEEAKEWYEYVYDPTEAAVPWKFLKFTGDIDGSDFLQDENQIQRYLNDPFDPHAIAALRIDAYRKSIVMNYVDNLLDWGDMLFRQYTVESINEARMLYILAYDLLGDKPENLGTLKMADDLTFTQFKGHLINDAALLDLENELGAAVLLPVNDSNRVLPAIDVNVDNAEMVNTLIETADPFVETTNDTILNPYFFIPENSLFLEYWNRVEERLHNIRHSLNIDGVQQPLPLFQPPIDPMALVQAVGSGAGLSQAMASMNIAVPHHRYVFMVNKTKELLQKLGQFGNELLSTLEKKDAEALNLMQSKQEGVILSMMQSVRAAQLEEAEYNLEGLKESLAGAQERLDYHTNTLENGLLPGEVAQMALMGVSIPMHYLGAALNVLSGVSHLIPLFDIGPFKFGAETPHLGESFESFGEGAASFAEALGVAGELAGMVAQHERMKADWEFQIMTSEQDVRQLEIQIKGAEIQVLMAKREIEILGKEIEQNKSIQNFMKDKFTNQQLYQWMASKLSGLYYQTYQMAYDFAKAAEKSFQFERGLKASEVNYIQPNYWNSQRKGLLAGNSLELDVDRMEKAFVETDKRRFEISKEFSLLEHDPIAFILLKAKGICEFNLSESFFDYDFQGHYCRQMKTITVTFDAGEGQTVNATLTQLSNKIVLEPDPKAVKFLLNPKDKQPEAIRSDWKASQQIVLSHVDQYKDSNGLFEDQLNDERYLPFEGTGAVSTWRLELNGKKGSYHAKDILDVTINIKYTALQGGAFFANAVKGMLKPYLTKRFFDVVYEFEQEWNAFMENDSDEFAITLFKEHFPNMSSSKVLGIFTNIETFEDGQVSLVLNGDEAMTLKDEKYTDTSGLSIRSRGTELKFKVKGNKFNIENLELVFDYKAKV